MSTIPELVKQGWRMRRLRTPRWRAVRQDGYSPCGDHDHGSVSEAWEHAIELYAATLSVESVGEDDEE